MRVLIILFLVILLYEIQCIIYTKMCFKNVSLKIDFSTDGIFEGESTILNQVIANKKSLPIWWLTTQFQVSRSIVFLDDEEWTLGNDNFRHEFFSISPYEKITRQFNILGAKRGFYKIDQIDLHSGDLFGIVRLISKYDQNTSMYVYPKLISHQEFDIFFKSLTGDVITRRNLLEDPFELRGIREYNTFDNMKTVNWKATARTGDLKVNQFDYTASQEVMLLLNVEKFNEWDSPRLIEETIRLGASFATEYLNKGMKVGLHSNACDIHSNNEINIPITVGNNQSMLFFRSLARADTKNISSPLSEILIKEQERQKKDTVFIIISHYYGEDLVKQIDSARKNGYCVKWILPKETDAIIDMNSEELYLWEIKETQV